MKQVLVIRVDLGMSREKMVTQGAHASVVAALDNLNDHRLVDWLKNSHTAACVRASSADELTNIFTKAALAKMIASIVTDVNEAGEMVATCCAVGPDLEDKVDRVTGHLMLL